MVLTSSLGGPNVGVLLRVLNINDRSFICIYIYILYGIVCDTGFWTEWRYSLCQMITDCMKPRVIDLYHVIWYIYIIMMIIMIIIYIYIYIYIII